MGPILAFHNTLRHQRLARRERPDFQLPGVILYLDLALNASQNAYTPSPPPPPHTHTHKHPTHQKNNNKQTKQNKTKTVFFFFFCYFSFSNWGLNYKKYQNSNKHFHINIYYLKHQFTYCIFSFLLFHARIAKISPF